MIEARSLVMQFGARRVVDDISFSIGAGEIVACLGPNGAGKSTTMRMLTGLLRPRSGQALICGHDIAIARREAQACIGYLPESPQGFAHLTVSELLRYCAESRGLWGRARADAIARVEAELELALAMHTRMAELSKGWRQRAWLAQALLHDPPVLILDEPTDGLDPAQKDRVRELIVSESNRRAVLFSSHQLDEAEVLCERVIVIANGQVLADRERDEMLDEQGRLTTSFRRLIADADADADAGSDPDNTSCATD